MDIKDFVKGLELLCKAQSSCKDCILKGKFENYTQDIDCGVKWVLNHPEELTATVDDYIRNGRKN